MGLPVVDVYLYKASTYITDFDNYKQGDYNILYCLFTTNLSTEWVKTADGIFLQKEEEQQIQTLILMP